MLISKIEIKIKKMMKQIVCINVEAFPHLQDLYQVIFETVNDIVSKEDVSSLSHETIIKRIADGSMNFQEMETDMKILQSKFFHYYSDDYKETIIQQTKDKIAIFSQE